MIYTLPEILVFTVALAVAVLAVWQIRQSRLMRRLEAAMTEQRKNSQRLNQHLTALLECSRRIGERLGENERAQRAMQKQIDSAPAGDENEVAIKHALKLLENGWALSEVTEICDLTQGEVEILQNLTRHQNQDAA